MRSRLSLLAVAASLIAVPAAAEETEAVEVVEVSRSVTGGGVSAEYEKRVAVLTHGAPVTIAGVQAALFSNTATGARGLCPSCDSTTPESRQNPGTNLIYAEGVMPREVSAPSFLRGTVSLSYAEGTLGAADISMRSASHALGGTVSIRRVGPDRIEVTERGEVSGPFAGTFADYHNRYFDLRSAVERGLTRAPRPAPAATERLAFDGAIFCDNGSWPDTDQIIAEIGARRADGSRDMRVWNAWFDQIQDVRDACTQSATEIDCAFGAGSWQRIRIRTADNPYRWQPGSRFPERIDGSPAPGRQEDYFMLRSSMRSTVDRYCAAVPSR